MSFETTALVLAWGAIVVLAFAMAGLLHQIRALTMLVSGRALPVTGPTRGQRVPPELLGDTAANGASEGRLLLFMERDCAGCAAIVPELERLPPEEAGRVSLVFRESAQPIGNGRLHVLDGMAPAFDRLQIPATPFAVRLARGGEVADAAAIGSPTALRQFIRSENWSAT